MWEFHSYDPDWNFSVTNDGHVKMIRLFNLPCLLPTCSLPHLCILYTNIYVDNEYEHYLFLLSSHPGSCYPVQGTSEFPRIELNLLLSDQAASLVMEGSRVFIDF
jgi:hypothetical protein